MERGYNYGNKLNFELMFIESFGSTYFEYHKENAPKYLKQLQKKGYFIFSYSSYIITTSFFRMKYMKKLHKLIANEHEALTQDVDYNINHLWKMYSNGVKKNMTRPFIVLSELSLLVYMKIIDNSEFSNIHQMLISEDEDNIVIGVMAIESLRKKRIKKYGVYSEKNKEAYSDVKKDYLTHILSLDLWAKYLRMKI